MRVRGIDGKTIRVNAKWAGVQGRRQWLRMVRLSRTRTAGLHMRWTMIATEAVGYGLGEAPRPFGMIGRDRREDDVLAGQSHDPLDVWTARTL